MSELEQALTLTAIDDGTWIAGADPSYISTNAMYGGWTTAVALKAAMLSHAGDAKPSAITVNFVERVDPGTDVVIRSRRVSGSRSITHVQSELTDGAEGRTLALATALFTDRRDTDGLTVPTMPHAPDPETLGLFHPPGSQGERSMIRPILGQPPFGNHDTVSTAWVREMTGRPVDYLQLAYLGRSVCAPVVVLEPGATLLRHHDDVGLLPRHGRRDGLDR